MAGKNERPTNLDKIIVISDVSTFGEGLTKANVPAPLVQWLERPPVRRCHLDNCLRAATHETYGVAQWHRFGED